MILFHFRDPVHFPKSGMWLLPSLKELSKDVLFFLFHTAETGNSFQLPHKREFSEENPAQNLPKVDASGEDRLWGGQMPTEELWKSKKHSVMSRQDLQTLCCTDGCSMTDLSALC